MYERLRAQVLPDLIPPRAKILVAVSGGPDSVALAHVLWRYAGEEKERGLELTLSHINHGVRPESAREEALVQGLGQKWGIPCVIHRFDAKKYVRLSGHSFQEGARVWRYQRWAQDMQELGCTYLATAHHLGDQAETVLYRFLRGSGTAGLAGILPSHKPLIRPLLTVTKKEILDYCAEEGLLYALDRSNEEPIYVRNKIRLKLLPELAKEYNPKIVQALGRTAALMRWDEEYLQTKTEEIWRDHLIFLKDINSGTEKDTDKDLDIEIYKEKDQILAEEVCLSVKVFNQPPALVSRVLRRAAAQVSGEPRGLGYDYIVRIMERGISARSQENLHWKQDFPGFQVEINPERIWFRRGRHGKKPAPVKVEVRLTEGSWIDIPVLGIKVGVFTDYSKADSMRADEGELAVFDWEKLLSLSDPLVCRTRRSGDKVWFKGIGHKDLKKVFQEEGVKAERRSRIPLIAAGNEVLWIPGVKRSDALRPGGKALYCVVLGCKP